MIDVVKTNTDITFFIRNKDLSIFRAILKGNKERILVLNTRHNVIEIYYFNGKYSSRGDEECSIEYFGASYEILDALFHKYRDNEDVLYTLAVFCLQSKSKSYWRDKLKDTPIATKVMATILGANE